MDSEELLAALRNMIDHEVRGPLRMHVDESRARQRSSRRVAVKSFVAGAVVSAAIFFSSFYQSPDRPVLLEHGSAPPAAYSD